MDSLTELDSNKGQEAMYLYKWLLARHDFRWSSRDDHKYLDRDMERERQILKLKEYCDPNGIIYNQFNPFKK